MRDSIKCSHDDEYPEIFSPHSSAFNQLLPSPPSASGSKTRAATDSYADPLPPSKAPLEAPRNRRHYIHPQDDSGVYMPTGPLKSTSDASIHPLPHSRPHAPLSNPFEDPQYEYCAVVPQRRPMREWQDVLEDQVSNAPGSGAKQKSGKAYRGLLRSRVRALFVSSERSTSKYQQHVGSTLLKGEGTHLARGTRRGLHCMDCEREMEARLLVR